jgi:UDP-N-acetyl-D-glucosamine dehydrogenase
VVDYHDPLVPELAEEGTRMSSVPLTDQALAEADAVVIVTDHTWVDYASVLEHAAVVVDARHVTALLLDESGSQSSAWIVKGGPE